jgi:hypothetical protein
MYPGRRSKADVIPAEDALRKQILGHQRIPLSGDNIGDRHAVTPVVAADRSLSRLHQHIFQFFPYNHVLSRFQHPDPDHQRIQIYRQSRRSMRTS